MAITITVTADDNHSIAASKKILSRQGELGETITFSLPSTLNAAYPRAWIMIQQPDGQLYYIDNGSGAGFTWPNPYTFTYNIGDRDTMLSSDGTLGIQIVLRDATPPAQTVEWRSRILYLTIEGSILSNVDSGGSLIDSLSSGTLNRLADIQYDSLADGDLLYRDTTTGKWRNVTLVEGLHITATLNKTSGTLTLSATGDISPNAEDVLLADVAGNFVATEVESALAELFDETVKNTGNETIAGIKTFASSPIVPTPTTDYQTSTKKYVDDKTSLLAEYEVTGSAVTSIDISGLDINTHKSYVVEIELKNATTSNSNISLFINGDTTATNYYTQVFGYSHTTAVAGRSNNATVCGLKNSTSSVVFAKFNIMLSDGGIANSLSHDREGVSMATPESYVYALTKAATVANITQLTFTASVANSIAVGSKIRIYRGDV